MPDIEVICNLCNAKYALPEDIQGRHSKCPHCGHVQRMQPRSDTPAQSETATAESSAPPSSAVTVGAAPGTAQDRPLSPATEQRLGRLLPAALAISAVAVLVFGIVVGATLTSAAEHAQGLLVVLGFFAMAVVIFALGAIVFLLNEIRWELRNQSRKDGER
jgi:hypothetical protein